MMEFPKGKFECSFVTPVAFAQMRQLQPPFPLDHYNLELAGKLKGISVCFKERGLRGSVLNVQLRKKKKNCSVGSVSYKQ